MTKYRGVKVSVFYFHVIDKYPSLSQDMSLYEAYISLMPYPILFRLSALHIIWLLVCLSTNRINIYWGITKSQVVKVSVYKKYFINNTPSLTQYMPLYEAYSLLIPCPILIRISIIPLIWLLVCLTGNRITKY